MYINVYIYTYAVPHPHHTTGGAGNIAPVYPYPSLLLTTTNSYQPPPTPLPTHRGGGEHSSCISILIPTTNCYSLLLTTTNPPTPYPPTGGGGEHCIPIPIGRGRGGTWEAASYIYILYSDIRSRRKSWDFAKVLRSGRKSQDPAASLEILPQVRTFRRKSRDPGGSLGSLERRPQASRCHHKSRDSAGSIEIPAEVSSFRRKPWDLARSLEFPLKTYERLLRALLEVEMFDFSTLPTIPQDFWANFGIFQPFFFQSLHLFDFFFKAYSLS